MNDQIIFSHKLNHFFKNKLTKNKIRIINSKNKPTKIQNQNLTLFFSIHTIKCLIYDNNKKYYSTLS